MKAEELKRYIANPGILGSAELANIEQMIEVYPFCQTFQTLKAKAIHNLQIENADLSLKKAALYASNRKSLYHTIYKVPSELVRIIESSKSQNVEGSNHQNVKESKGQNVETSNHQNIEGSNSQNVEIEQELEVNQLVEDSTVLQFDDSTILQFDFNTWLLKLLFYVHQVF